MVKPKFGYAHEKLADKVDFPAGWREGQFKDDFEFRRAFFEVHLLNWVVRHNI